MPSRTYPSPRCPPPFPGWTLDLDQPRAMLNTRCAQWRTYHSKIWAIRGPLQKVTGYRYEEETACEQRTRDFKQPGPPWPTPPPPAPRPSPTIVSPLFFVSSSFLIAANRDVKTIRALLADSVPMLNSFFAYSHSFSLSLSLSLVFHPLGIVTSTRVCLLKHRLPPSIIYCWLLNSVRLNNVCFT